MTSNNQAPAGGQLSPPAGEPDRNALVEEHLHLVGHVVQDLSQRFPRHVDRQELWNAGAYGLVDASRRYDESTGIPFGRYAMIRIRGAIIDSTRTRDWATRAVRRNMRTVRAATETFQQTHGREPTSDELADKLGITVDQLDEYRQAAVTSSLLHLDQRISRFDRADGDLPSTLGELVEEDHRERLPEDRLEQRELTGTLRVAVTQLPEVQREVVERYYFGGEYLRDIADRLGVTEARVSQIRSEALTAIRAYFATTFDNVTPVPDDAPGQRRRAAYLARMAEESNWRTRLAAAESTEQAGQETAYAPGGRS